jgi:hypothetical protein
MRAGCKGGKKEEGGGAVGENGRDWEDVEVDAGVAEARGVGRCWHVSDPQVRIASSTFCFLCACACACAWWA